MTALQQRQASNRVRAVGAITEDRRLRDALRRLDKSLLVIQAEEIRARQQGDPGEALRLATEREQLEDSRRTSQAAFNEVSQEIEAIRALVREEERRIRDRWRWPW